MCDHDVLDWDDIALAGALAEEIVQTEKERERLRTEVEEGRKRTKGILID
jgi:hypothetical protein